MTITDPKLSPVTDDIAGVPNGTPDPISITGQVPTCTWCSTPMTADLLGDGMHPGCGDTLHQSAAVPPEHLGPCALCGTPTERYGDGAASTLCPDCQDVTR